METGTRGWGQGCPDWGTQPCLGAVLPLRPQTVPAPSRPPRSSRYSPPARPLPTRREPPVTCRRRWAAAPLAPQPPQPWLPRRLPPRPPLPGDRGQHRSLARSLGAAGPALLSSAARGTRLGMLRSSHPNSAEEEKQGESPASVLCWGRRKEPVSKRKGGKKRQGEDGGKKTSGQ